MIASNLVNTLSFVVFVLGSAVLAVFVFAVLVCVVFYVIPAIWRAICHAGFTAFASAEEKREARKLGRERAQFEHQLNHESTPEPAMAFRSAEYLE